nr:ABC transporter permease [Bacteroidota bacterium]
MFANFFKIAFRNILRQKIYTVINVIGLSIGIAAFILISLWIIDELSYENMHDKADQTILVHKSFTMGDSYEVNPSTPYLLGPTAKDEIPEVIESVRVMRQSAVVNYEDLYFTENSICATDPSYFTVFNFEFLLGDPQHSLENPNSIVITKSVAQKYFGDDDPLGKVLWFDKEEQFVVSAVIGDIPDNTNLRSNMIVPIETMCANKDYASNWYDHFLSTYLLITPTISKQDINQKLTDHIRKYMEEDSKIELVGQPLSRLHLYNLDGKNERIQYVYIFSIIGFLILGIACINYMNISTSLSVRRSREIGLKKVVGAEKSQLVLQFLGESFLQTLAGLFIAMMLVELVRPYFNDLAAKSIYIPYLSAWFLPSLFLLLILTTLIAGSYPAF